MHSWFFFWYIIGKLPVYIMKYTNTLETWLYSAGYRWFNNWNNQSFFQNFPFPTTIARAGNVPLHKRVAVVAENHNTQKASLSLSFSCFLSVLTYTLSIGCVSLFINQKWLSISIFSLNEGLFSGVNCCMKTNPNVV